MECPVKRVALANEVIQLTKWQSIIRHGERPSVEPSPTEDKKQVNTQVAVVVQKAEKPKEKL